MTIVSSEKLIQAPLHLAYRAFTNSTSLRGWYEFDKARVTDQVWELCS